MYQEWTRDFRGCKADCEEAISHLREGTLSEWYGEKEQHIIHLATSMLSNGQGPDEAHQIIDTRTNLMIPSELVTMNRLGNETRRATHTATRKYEINFVTERVSQVVIDVQETQRWTNSWETLGIFFRNPETRVAAGKLFQKMFLQKFSEQNPNKMPLCYELPEGRNGPHPESRSANAAVMPWNGLRQQPKLEWISVGTDTDGSLYAKKELQEVITAVIAETSRFYPSIRFLIPCAQNWASWDAAVVVGKSWGRIFTNKTIDIVFLQLTVDPKHNILAKGLNQVRDAIPEGRFDIQYHYVIVLLTDADGTDGLKIPVWRPVLNNSKDRKKDDSWGKDKLKEYVMFVPRTALCKE